MVEREGFTPVPDENGAITLLTLIGGIKRNDFLVASATSNVPEHSCSTRRKKVVARLLTLEKGDKDSPDDRVKRCGARFSP